MTAATVKTTVEVVPWVKTYHGKSCRKCGETLRYLADGHCVRCRREWATRRSNDPTVKCHRRGCEEPRHEKQTFCYRHLVESYLKSSEKKSDPTLKHPAYIRNRENSWRRAGILEPDGSGRFLSWATYEAVFEFQGKRCALCDRVFFHGERRNASADHDHKTGLFRGILCGGKIGCNLKFVARVENHGRQRHIDNDEPNGLPLADDEVHEYLNFPPAQGWLRSMKLGERR